MTLLYRKTLEYLYSLPDHEEPNDKANEEMDIVEFTFSDVNWFPTSTSYIASHIPPHLTNRQPDMPRVDTDKQATGNC